MKDEIFLALDDKGKRIALAQEVILQLKVNKIEAMGGSYLIVKKKNDTYMHDEPPESELQELLKQDYTYCRCCVKGAMLIAEITKIDEFKIYDLRLTQYNSGIFEKRITCFSTHQKDLMEVAFEGVVIGDRDPLLGSRLAPTELARRAMSFGFGASAYNDKQRLSAIMENVIANEGEFIP